MSAKAYESKAKNAPDGYEVIATPSSPLDNSLKTLSSGGIVESESVSSVSSSGGSGRSIGSSVGSGSKFSSTSTSTSKRAVAQVDPEGSRTTSFRPPHAYARMGPSNRADGMPPFCWKAFSRNRDKRGKVFSHAGQPDCFDFAWQAMPPPLKE